VSDASLLTLTGVSVVFGGLTAVRDVDLAVEGTEIAAVIGPNGAGKTTTFNVITGAQRPTTGRVRFAGANITAAPAVRRARLGMARTFQNLALVGSLTAAENVAIGAGRFRRTGLPGAVLRLRSTVTGDHRADEVARGALAFVGLGAAADRPAAELSYGDRRRVELARALALRPRLLLLDEPSAGMDPVETAELAAVIRRAADELGIAVLLVEHDMTFVRALAARTTVLDFGAVVVSGPTEEVLRDERVVAAYLGTAA